MLRGALAAFACAGLLCAQTSSVTTDASGTPLASSPAASDTPRPLGQPQNGTALPPVVFLSGTVMTDDGSTLPRGVTIQSVCGPVRRAMAHVADNGSFAFRWTTMSSSFGDASQVVRTSGNGSASLTGSRSGSRGLDPLANCELFAEVAGYSSSRASLYNREGQSAFDVGAIVIHRIAESDGRSVSILSLEAPKDARKEFEKGMRLAGERPADALASFEKALSLYPKYADAWLNAGKAQWILGRVEDARADFRKAMELDNRLVGPWQELGYLACAESKWEDALHYLDQAVRLDPVGAATPWYFSAIANYNLGRYDAAERGVRTELRLDHGKNPQGIYLLGLVLIALEDFKAGAEALHSYLAIAPAAPDAAAARRELSKLQEKAAIR
ncbi:MAG TPA: tetratricopeptide repeat protein [Bryobacteraceae bacterium]|nr:tetratricopeptide repeat protein [Bryobacteraceae bacterium]